MSGTPVDNGDEIIIFQKKHKNQESTSTESIDLNDDTKEEDMDNDELKDMGLFDSVFVNVQGNKKIYGALYLFIEIIEKETIIYKLFTNGSSYKRITKEFYHKRYYCY
ncbi:hypothetical protein EDI_327230 [Entamoeba dispar SAW760]|uniref:Uncharacterized protein n=1 Tax=Entamoeba dispar (strain ATCC PRA-260 / SAW760) TaxID=370354 RepID=B0E7M6_ENTDS|nr:uncharacterized protein EDI_327230 [Entamoeba dispar SAW760]EDR29470.1 hypothetical protein EDI_327230 [Entamoeba dispar SAW760]|eukprot:EDR29470.1 hypothetical protein EDI_327230 [Entamoeba dispar SAW760]